MVASQLARAALFSLSDSDPDSPEFRRRFMASYGVNEAIEPKLTQADRPLQEAILPHLRNNPRTAIQLIEQALKPDTNPAFLNILGNLYYQVDDFSSSERYLRQALEKFPALRRSWRTLALSLVQRNQWENAVAPLLKVIELGGGDAQSYGLLAYAYLSMEKYESALAAYRMARIFEPDSLDFRRGQALCLVQTEQPRAAIALFDELIAEHPDESRFWLGQANAYLAVDERKKAIANLQIVADSGKGSWDSWILLADLYLNEDIPQLALQSYSNAFQERPPSDLSVAVRPLHYFVSRRLFAEARIYLDLIRSKLEGELDPKEQRKLLLSEARIEMSEGLTVKALERLKSVVASDPLDGEALLQLGEYYLEQEEFGEAEFHFERATSIESVSSDAYIALGQLHVAQGELQAALSPLRKAFQKEPAANLQRYIDSIERALELGK